jgi:metal-dependent amidase/aminoacylase/carboxypeptidase family protein
MEFGVVTVGAFNSGSAGNIIPDQARLLGTIRSYKSEVRTRMHEGIERTPRRSRHVGRSCPRGQAGQGLGCRGQ